MAVNVSQFDPTKQLVSLAGFTYDWIITREWRKVFLAGVPIALLVTLVALVFWGKNLDRNRLAAWYKELGDAEIEQWETAWRSEEPGAVISGSDAEESAQQGGEFDLSESRQLSDYADLLYRRVQLLAPTNRSEFVIGLGLVQRGAITQGTAMLQKLAPDKESGYAPAHAFLALIYMEEQRQGVNERDRNVVMHHIKNSMGWTSVPNSVLLAGYTLSRRSQPSLALGLLQRAAEKDRSLNLELAKFAQSIGNRLVLEQAAEKSFRDLREQLEKDPLNDDVRVSLAQLHLLTENVDEAERLLRAQGENVPQTDQMKLWLSNVYIVRFSKSMSEGGNIGYLDMAYRIDPNNELVAEQVAKLAGRTGEFRPTDEMIENLKQKLAEGKATTLTHKWLAETFLVRGDYQAALPHLQQVVLRKPDAINEFNNLAFVLAELDENRLEEALTYSNQAVRLSQLLKKPNPNYHDTMGTILLKMNRPAEAQAAFTSAIELALSQPQKFNEIPFRKNIVKAFRQLGDLDSVARHERLIDDAMEKQALEIEKRERARQQAQLVAANDEEEANTSEDAMPAVEQATNPADDLIGSDPAGADLVDSVFGIDPSSQEQSEDSKEESSQENGASESTKSQEKK